jgi:hypothetical protein
MEDRMSTVEYGGRTDLRSMIEQIHEVRTRLEEHHGQPPTAQEFYAALRQRSPEMPEVPKALLVSGSPDNLEWPDNCGAWLGVALDCYQAAVDALDAGNRTGVMFHSAEGSYALTQATQCLHLGF